MRTAYKFALAGALFAILLVSVIDVAGRYLVNAPLFGAGDLIRFGMAIVVFGALPAVCWAGEHITVDLVTDRMSPALRAVSERVFRGLAAIGLAYIAWRLLELGLQSRGERSTLLLIPVPPLIFFMAGCAAIAAAVELVRMAAPAAPAKATP